MARPLPPDPDDKNDDRAEWALQAVECFQAATGTDDGDAFADLLCDLYHLADRRPEFGTLEAALRRAAYNYEAETTAE